MNILYYDLNKISPEILMEISKNFPEELRHETIFLPKDLDFVENVSQEEIARLKKFIDDIYYLGVNTKQKED